MEESLELLQCYEWTRDDAAFEEIVRRYRTMVVAEARRVTGDVGAAEDVAQECFFELSQRAGSIRESVGAYLKRAAHHRSVTAVRKECRWRKQQALRQEVKPEPSGLPDELTGSLEIALAKLPSKLRDPVVQYFMGNRPQQEIAEELGVNCSTVSRRISEGLAELRRELVEA